MAMILLQANVAAAESPPSSFDIGGQPLAGALNEFARQSSRQILFSTEVVQAKRTRGVKGELEPEAALRQLLEGTGLTYRVTADDTILVEAARSGESADSRAEGAQLEEIVVTAQKRVQRLQDVPVPVTVISGQSLVSSNQLRLQDYYSSVPGLSLTPGSQSTQVLSIRGIASGSIFNPTVGVTIDDVPYGASGANAGGNVVPDIDPSDLTSVEVLRGPQGTLYGASSMGGLLKFVTVDPSTEAVTGRVQAGWSDVRNGSESGYNFRGAINVPVSEDFAIRASAYTRRDPGYIDNVLTGEKGVNRIDVDGGRLSALWRPSDDFSVKLSALAQQSRGHGASSVSRLPGLRDLEQSYARGAGAFDNELQAYSSTITAALGRFDLTSVSGYNVNEPHDSADLSAFFGSDANDLHGVSGVLVNEQLRSSKFTQELRLSTLLGEKAEWLIGAFYTSEKSRWRQSIDAVEPTQGTLTGNILIDTFPTTLKEYAAFTNVTFHVTDRFDVQVGARQSKIKQSNQDTLSGDLFAEPIVSEQFKADSSPFTYLLTPSFKISPDLMLYARLASGYRVGGTNSALNAPPQYDPDKAQNYELGFKGDFFERTLAVDASAYYIDWKNIQVLQSTYVSNAPRAKSQGIELSVELRPVESLRISAWAVWSEAELTEDFPADSISFGRSGDSLPASSRYSANLSVRTEFPLGSADGFLGSTLNYVGERKGVFTTSAERQVLPAYAKVDVVAGATYGSWTINLFLNNLTDKRGVLSGGLGEDLDPTGFYYITPRSVGMSLVKAF
jgi:iron complex outermembrane recepter protein